jgi:RNA polymerase primary sigma factor
VRPSTPPAENLHAELARGQRLDRELARALGRPEPDRARDLGDYVEALESRTPLTPPVERRLVEAARSGDAAARARLVDAFMPLIDSLARRYRNAHVQRIELLQEGVVGLLRALEGFDPARGTPFWAYASWWVRQAMQQVVAELTRPVVLSDRGLRQLARVREAHRDSVARDGREPTRAQLAERTGLSADQIDGLLRTERPARSLQEPAEGDEGAIGTLGELIADPLAEGEYERVLDAMQARQLHALLAGLSDREREVLRSRYGLDGDEQSLRDVGARLGLSGERVRQIERRALGKLAAVAAGA